MGPTHKPKLRASGSIPLTHFLVKPMQVRPEKCGKRDDGKEIFVLVNAESGAVITKKPASENSIRKFFAKHGASEKDIDEALRRARRRYDNKANEADKETDDDFLDDVFAEL